MEQGRDAVEIPHWSRDSPACIVEIFGGVEGAEFAEQLIKPVIFMASPVLWLREFPFVLSSHLIYPPFVVR